MLRPPLSVVTVPPNQTIKPLDDSQDDARRRPHSEIPPAKRKRVMFDQNGTRPLSGVTLNCVALLLADERETRSTTRKKRKYDETLDLLKSASAWDKYSLGRFGVEFHRLGYTPLSVLIKDGEWYDVTTESKPSFAKRTARRGFIADSRLRNAYQRVDGGYRRDIEELRHG